eukprot:3427234-Rhodomonas_salina.2
MPPARRPRKRTQSSADLVLSAPKAYSAQNTSVPAFLPLESTSLPTEGPRRPVVPKPTRKS